MRNKVLIMSQVFWPESFGSSRHITELSIELVKRGWDVTALITNRTYLDSSISIAPKKGYREGVRYERIKLPALSQKKDLPRLMSGILLVLNWIFRSPSFKHYDIVIIGTSPPFAYLALPFIRLFNKNAKLFLWGFDLYPEAIMASGGKLKISLGKLLKPFTKRSLKKLDYLIDIGPCMRKRYGLYQPTAIKKTLTPWSFIEPSGLNNSNGADRKPGLTLLYSGTIGFAHDLENFLLLARELKKRNASVSLCFAGIGNKFKNFKKLIHKDDTNITIINYTNNDEEFQSRVANADIMMISLKEEYAGISVPSKFFGAIAFGKPILYSGSNKSAIFNWMTNNDIGFHLTKKNISATTDILIDLEKNKSKLSEMSSRAFTLYNSHHSKKIICDKWSNILMESVNNCN